MRLRTFLSSALIAGLVTLPASAEACTACMGKPTDSPMAGAMNGAIYFMLLCIGAMLAFITTVGFMMVRRSHAPLPPHSQFAGLTHDADSHEQP